MLWREAVFHELRLYRELRAQVSVQQSGGKQRGNQTASSDLSTLWSVQDAGVSTNGGVLCDFRINLDIIRTESSTNLKKLLELQRKVLSSNDNVKQQYEKPIQVSNGGPLYLPCYTHRGSVQCVCS